MRGTYVHLRFGILLALEEQAKVILGPLVDLQQLRLETVSTVDDAAILIQKRSPRILIADYERFGAAGVDGLADLMALCDAPVILFARDTNERENEQFAELGVQRVFDPTFRLSELATEVESALKRRRRIGSSDRLPAVV